MRFGMLLRILGTLGVMLQINACAIFPIERVPLASIETVPEGGPGWWCFEYDNGAVVGYCGRSEGDCHDVRRSRKRDPDVTSIGFCSQASTAHCWFLGSADSPERHCARTQRQCHTDMRQIFSLSFVPGWKRSDDCGEYK